MSMYELCMELISTHTPRLFALAFYWTAGNIQVPRWGWDSIDCNFAAKEDCSLLKLLVITACVIRWNFSMTNISLWSSYDTARSVTSPSNNMNRRGTAKKDCSFLKLHVIITCAVKSMECLVHMLNNMLCLSYDVVDTVSPSGQAGTRWIARCRQKERWFLSQTSCYHNLCSFHLCSYFDRVVGSYGQILRCAHRLIQPARWYIPELYHRQG